MAGALQAPPWHIGTGGISFVPHRVAYSRASRRNKAASYVRKYQHHHHYISHMVMMLGDGRGGGGEWYTNHLITSAM